MAKGKFKLTHVIEGSTTTVSLNAAQGGGILSLNRGTATIKNRANGLPNLPVASQKDLQVVYDNAPEFAKIIEAPKGHVAPWQKFEEAGEEE